MIAHQGIIFFLHFCPLFKITSSNVFVYHQSTHKKHVINRYWSDCGCTFTNFHLISCYHFNKRNWDGLLCWQFVLCGVIFSLIFFLMKKTKLFICNKLVQERTIATRKSWIGNNQPVCLKLLETGSLSACTSDKPVKLLHNYIYVYAWFYIFWISIKIKFSDVYCYEY